MKKLMALLLCISCLLMLPACGGKDVEPPAAAEKPVPVEVIPPAEELTGETTLNLFCGEQNFSICLPAGWAYDELEGDLGLLKGLRIYPEGADRFTHSFCLGFHEYMFGVCGTGLEEKELVLEDGNAVCVGYYDGGSDWSFVSFRSLDETLAATNDGLAGEEAVAALAILKTLNYGGAQEENTVLVEKVRRIRADRYGDGSALLPCGNASGLLDSSRPHLPTYVFEGADALAAFMNRAREEFQIWQAYSPENESLEEALSVYDETFFGEHRLLMIQVEAGSGSYQHEVTDLSVENDTAVVTVAQSLPGGVGTADMANWFLLVECPREVLKNVTNFDAVLAVEP